VAARAWLAENMHIVNILIMMIVGVVIVGGGLRRL